MKRNYYIVTLIMLTFFVISFLTNIIGPLSPEFIKDFKLSDLLAGALPFAFFIAYGVMSIPSSMLVQKYNEKVIMVVAFVVAFSGLRAANDGCTYLTQIFSINKFPYQKGANRIKKFRLFERKLNNFFSKKMKKSLFCEF